MDISQWIQQDLDEVTTLIREIDQAEVRHLGELTRQAKRIFVVGQGRSGLVMRMFATRLMQLGLSAFVVGDAVTPATRQGDLVIVGSGSGETPGVASAAQRAKRILATVVGLTADRNSTLSRLADHSVFLPGGAPRVKTAKTMKLPLGDTLEQSMLVLLDCLVALLAEEMAQSDEVLMARHANLE